MKAVHRTSYPLWTKARKRKGFKCSAKTRNRWRRVIRSLLLFLLMVIPAFSLPVQSQTPATFPCNNSLYVSRGQGTDFNAPTVLNTINPNTTPFTLNPIPGIPVNPNIRYNAIGFNFQDGFIYGIDPDTGVVYRITPDGQPISLGTPPGLPIRQQELFYLAGDVDVNGSYLVLSIEPTQPTQQLYRINVTGSTATLVGTPITLSEPTNVADIAVNPLDGQLYGFDFDNTVTPPRRRMVRIDPTNGLVTPYPSPTLPIELIGGTFFDGFGQFFAYETVEAGSAFYLVDVGTANAPGTGQFRQISAAQGVSRNDGAACAFAVQLEKDVVPGQVIAGGTVTYTYRISNSGPFPVTNLTFRDVMPDSRTFVADTLRLTNISNGTPNTYGGTQTLQITGMSIPARTVAQISVDVRVPPDIAIGTIFNQSEISGLPPRFGNPNLPSDFVPVVGFPDPTPLIVTANPIIGVAKAAIAVADLGNGNFQLTYNIVIENLGNVDLTNVQVTENLTNTFGSTPFTINRVSSPTGNLTPNNNFDGVNTTNLLAGTDTLAIGESKTIELVVTITPGNNPGPYDNQAVATGQSPAGPTTDTSTDGLDPDPDGDGDPTNNSGSTPLDLSNPPGTGPRLRLVKRITNATRGGVPISGINFNSVVNDPSNANDNVSAWSQLPGGLLGIPRLGSETPLQSSDEVEYTIYFLSDGSQAVQTVRICDPIPAGTTFIPNSFGSGSGILLYQNSAQTLQTNALDTDQGTFASPLTPVAPPCPDANNPNGSVLLELGDIPNTAPTNVGFVRFRVKID
jgi:uncharacterized repeat protein (TIGR01451 family)